MIDFVSNMNDKVKLCVWWGEGPYQIKKKLHGFLGDDVLGVVQ